MEEDTDQEILALKNHYERQLHEQCDENLKLRGDTGILKKKVFKNNNKYIHVHILIIIINKN